jgi:hypothetical protein
MWVVEPTDSSTPSHWEFREIQRDGAVSRLIPFDEDGEPLYAVAPVTAGPAGRLLRELVARDMEKPEFWHNTSWITAELFDEAWSKAEQRQARVLHPPTLEEDGTPMPDAD